MPLRSVHVRRCGSPVWSVATAMGLWLVLGTLVAVRATGPDDVISFHPFSLVDFRDSVWLPVLHFMDGGIPWDRPSFTGTYPEVQFYPLYVPSYWWLTAPLLLLPYRAAAVLWTGLLVACLVWMVHRSLTLWFEDTLSRFPWLVAAVTAATLVLRPVQTSLSQGNWALLCAAGTMLALVGNHGLPGRCLGIERWISPVVLGTCVAIVKPNVGLPLLLALALTGRAREACRALGLTTLLGLPIGLIIAQRAGGSSAGHPHPAQHPAGWRRRPTRRHPLHTPGPRGHHRPPPRQPVPPRRRPGRHRAGVGPHIGLWGHRRASLGRPRCAGHHPAHPLHSSDHTQPALRPAGGPASTRRPVRRLAASAAGRTQLAGCGAGS